MMTFGKIGALVLGFLLLSIGTGAGAENGLPWTKFSVQAADATASMISACNDGQPVFLAQFKRGGRAYMSFYGMDSEKYLLVEYASDQPGAPVARAGLGVVDMKTPGKHDEIPQLRWLKLTPSMDACKLIAVAATA